MGPGNLDGKTEEKICAQKKKEINLEENKLREGSKNHDIAELSTRKEPSLSVKKDNDEHEKISENNQIRNKDMILAKQSNGTKVSQSDSSVTRDCNFLGGIDSKDIAYNVKNNKSDIICDSAITLKPVKNGFNSHFTDRNVTEGSLQNRFCNGSSTKTELRHRHPMQKNPENDIIADSEDTTDDKMKGNQNFKSSNVIYTKTLNDTKPGETCQLSNGVKQSETSCDSSKYPNSSLQFRNKESSVKSEQRYESTPKSSLASENDFNYKYGFEKSDYSGIWSCYGMGRNYNLVKYESLPEFLHDNEFLIDGHRPVLNSASECLKSVLHLHTETWNVWTHLLGAIMTVLLMWYHVVYISSGDFLAFLCFFCGAVFCQTVSALYHTLICHSEPVCKLFAKLDYCGVITLITASEIAWLHFAFYCYPKLKVAYIGMAAISCVLSLCLALQDKFREPAYRWIRFGLFAGLALSTSLPTLHYYLLNDPTLPPSSAPLPWVFLMGAVYAIGGLFYVTRVPERFFPGMFDIHCQSHQLLHICVVLGVLCCYVGLSKYSALRINAPCGLDPTNSITL